MSALHQAISNVDLAAMRASLTAGASPYSLDEKGRTAWDRINQNPMFHVHLGSKSRTAWTIREILADMAKVPPKTLEQRTLGDQAHAEALTQKVSAAVLVAGLIKKAILKLSKLEDSQLDALGFENIGRRQVEQALAGRALNPKLPPPDTGLRAQLEAAEVQGAAQAAAKLQTLEVDANGVIVEKRADGTFARAQFVFLDNSLLQDLVDEVQALKDATPVGEVLTFEMPALPPEPAPPALSVVPASPPAKTDKPAPAPVGGRPPRLNIVTADSVPHVAPAQSQPTVETWRADRPVEDPKPGPKPFNRPPRVG